MRDTNDSHRDELEERASRYAELFPFVDGENIEVCLAILRTSTVLGRAIGRKIRPLDYNLNGARLQVLRTLYLAPDKRLPLKEIARQMAVSSTNITTIIDVLERDGWISRLTNEADRRVTYAALTEVGENRCLEFLPVMLQAMNGFSLDLSASERGLLLSMLANLRNHAESIEGTEKTGLGPDI